MPAPPLHDGATSQKTQEKPSPAPAHAAPERDHKNLLQLNDQNGARPGSCSSGRRPPEPVAAGERTSVDPSGSTDSTHAQTTTGLPPCRINVKASSLNRVTMQGPSGQNAQDPLPTKLEEELRGGVKGEGGGGGGREAGVTTHALLSAYLIYVFPSYVCVSAPASTLTTYAIRCATHHRPPDPNLRLRN